MKDKIRTGYFAEVIDLSEAQMDTDGKRVRVTLIKPGWSANGRYYGKEVLARSAGMFEGTKAYFDHPSRDEAKNRPERSVRDLAGWYENVKQEADGRLTADLNIDHPDAWRIIETAVTRKPDYAGLSINALGSTRKGEAEGRSGVLVEDIAKANSTDIVTTPAAGGKFEQLLMADDGFTRDLLEAMPLDELQDVLRETRPDLIEAYKTEWKTVRDTQAMEAVRAEADAATTKLAALTEEHRTTTEALAEALETISALRKEQMVDRLLSDKTLPDAWKLDLRETLLKAEQAEWTTIMEREARKAEAIRPKAAISGAGRLAPTIEAVVSTHKPTPKNTTAPREDETYSAWLRRTGRTK